MLIFYTQFTAKNPDETSRKRFDRMKIKMGKVFSKIKKDTEKHSKERIMMKAGENWFAVHSFFTN